MKSSFNDELDEISSDEESRLSNLLHQWNTPDSPDNSAVAIRKIKMRKVIFNTSVWGCIAAGSAAIFIVFLMPIKNVNVVELNKYSQKQYNYSSGLENKTSGNERTSTIPIASAPLVNQGNNDKRIESDKSGYKKINKSQKKNYTQDAEIIKMKKPGNINSYNNQAKVEFVTVAVLNSITETE